jgi:hypothetical protein
MLTSQKKFLTHALFLFIFFSIFGITCNADDSIYHFLNHSEAPIKKEAQASEIKYDFDSPILLSQKHQFSIRQIYNKVFFILSNHSFTKELEYFDLIEYQILCHKWQFFLGGINPVRAPPLFS